MAALLGAGLALMTVYVIESGILIGLDTFTFFAIHTESSLAGQNLGGNRILYVRRGFTIASYSSNSQAKAGMNNCNGPHLWGPHALKLLQSHQLPLQNLE